MADYISSDAEYDYYSSWMNYFIYESKQKTLEALSFFKRKLNNKK